MNATIDIKQLRRALGSFATGVTIVSTRSADGTDIGLTANSFNSVSLDPPMVLWSLAKTAASLPAFMETVHFAVHILASDQRPLSDRFARRGIDKFEGLELERGPGKIPLIPGCSARFQCRTAYRYEGGDHIIFVGEVLAFDHYDRQPLIFHSGSYGKIIPRPAPADAPVAEVESSFRKDFLGYLLGVATRQIVRPVENRYTELGLSEAGYYVITVLAARGSSTAAEMNRLLTVGGHSLTPELLSGLVAGGLVTASGSGNNARLELTAQGRERAIELFAVAKAAEDAAAEVLDIDEARLLKELLKRLIKRN